MYPTQMRRHKIIRILLSLFIVNYLVNFVFGAPVAIREELQGCIYAGGTEEGTAALQKRINVEEGLTIMEGQTPSSFDGPEVDRLRHEMGQLGMGLMTRHIPAPTLSYGDLTPLTPPTPPTPPGPYPRHYSPYLLNHPYSIPLANPRISVHPNVPARPYRPISTSLVRPTRLRPYNRPVSLLRPSRFRPISPPPPPEDRLQPASSLSIDNPSTTGHWLTSQQNSMSDLEVRPPLNQEFHPLPNPGPHPSTQGETAADKASDILKDTKIKRTFPAPVQ